MDFDWGPPSFCGNCGTSFSWTAGAKASANELIDMLDTLSEPEREALRGTLDDLISDTPATEVAAMRFKLLARKAGHEGGAALRAIVTSVATEAAKRAILG
jgi:hypothetical protein